MNSVPQPHRRTNDQEDNAVSTESGRKVWNNGGTRLHNTAVEEMMKKKSSDMSNGSSIKQSVQSHGQPVGSRTAEKSSKEPSSEEVATNLSLSFQAAQERFKKKMAIYSQQVIGEPVNYTRDNIPPDLRALAPKLFLRFPREFLPDYKSPCWKVQNGTVQCLPYFFIGGFPKCATTDLWGKLMTHPDLVRVIKEPHWWARTQFEDLQIDGYIQNYDKLVREMESQQRKDLVACDASACTFNDRRALLARLQPNLRGNMKYDTADFIRAALPDAKIVGIMRNPTKREYSSYMFFNKTGRLRRSPQDFHVDVVEAIKAFYRCTDNNDLQFCANMQNLNVGCYSFYIREYMRRFPRDQLYFLRTEDWSKDPAHYMKEIYTFLNIDPLSEEFRQKVTTAEKLNQRKSEESKLGPMLPQTKKLLDDFYRPCNEDLATLLKDDRYLWHNDT